MEETFFTVIGCMDGRCHRSVVDYGRKKFDANYADAITEPGLVGMLAQNPSKAFLNELKSKIDISVDKHGSKGIIVDGHSDCAGDSVEDSLQKKHVEKAVSIIRKMVKEDVSVVGVFVYRKGRTGLWDLEQISSSSR